MNELTVKSHTIRKTFSRKTVVEIEINAETAKVWSLLIDATNYPKWNSTIISIDGNIALGEKIKLKSQLDPERVFKLAVKKYEPESRLVWGDAMGRREYRLTSYTKRKTTFTMVEKIGGPLFPFFAKMIPSFDESFEKFATELKMEAEK